MTGIKSLIKRYNWHSQTSAAPLAVYRIGFGALMIFSTIRFMANGWVHTQYIEPSYHFSYLGFSWLPYPSELGVYLLFTGILLGAILIMLGLFYRFGTILFFICFTYVELLDKANYLNHYYFVSLIALLLVFIPANRYFSLDTKIGITKHSNTCPRWNIHILMFQIGVVYFFAGIAKLEVDWLVEAQPLKYWLHTAHHIDFIGPLLKQDWVAHLFAWFACIFDLSIIFLLAIKKTRKWAYLLVIVFHLSTWMLFPIGVFPWVMMMATTIFFAPKYHELFLDKMRLLVGRYRGNSPSTLSQPRKFVNIALGGYIAIQLLMPLRNLVYDGNGLWTEQGFRFSWKVMLVEKAGYATFYITDRDSSKELVVDNSNFLTPNQEKMMSTQPDMILQFANHLEEVYQDTSITKYGVEMEFFQPEVHAEVYVTLNSRPHQLLVDKKHNLAALENDLSPKHWLEDFKE